MQVVSLGDLVLDVVVRVRSEVAHGADTPAQVALSAGGQGANVAAWVAALGASSRWIGKRADDAEGRLASEALERAGVELAGPVETDGNGVIVSLVEPGGERSMFPDRGSRRSSSLSSCDPYGWSAITCTSRDTRCLRSPSCVRPSGRSTSPA